MSKRATDEKEQISKKVQMTNRANDKRSKWHIERVTKKANDKKRKVAH